MKAFEISVASSVILSVAAEFFALCAIILPRACADDEYSTGVSVKILNY
jgi:hypothetical protein